MVYDKKAAGVKTDTLQIEMATKWKSKFFAGSSSESENESDNDSGSSDENPINQRQAAGRFANAYDESDSGERLCKILNL